MKRQATLGMLGVLAVAGTVGISLQSGVHRGGENGTEARQVHEKQARGTTSATAAAERERACADIVQNLEVFLAVLVPRPKSCFADDFSHPAEKVNAAPAWDLRFVVATLPDPIHTHLALIFDRLAQVIQEAAQDESYSYEASWLPWEDKEQSYTTLTDEDRAGDRKDLIERQPGILLFRRNPPFDKSKPNSPAAGNPSAATLLPYREGLIVFVVGEDPTRGIHTEQFENALAWIDKLEGLQGNQRGRTAILGPTFSGSFPSLAKLLSIGESEKYLSDIRGDSSVPLAIYSENLGEATGLVDVPGSDAAAANAGGAARIFMGQCVGDEWECSGRSIQIALAADREPGAHNLCTGEVHKPQG